MVNKLRNNRRIKRENKMNKTIAVLMLLLLNALFIAPSSVLSEGLNNFHYTIQWAVHGLLIYAAVTFAIGTEYDNERDILTLKIPGTYYAMVAVCLTLSAGLVVGMVSDLSTYANFNNGAYAFLYAGMGFLNYCMASDIKQFDKLTFNKQGQRPPC